MNLKNLEIKIENLKSKKLDLIDKIKEEKVELRLLEKEKLNIEKCLKILEYLSKCNQDKIVKLFEDTVGVGLKDLFDETYDFRILQKSRGNSSACDFQVSCSVFPGWSDVIMCHGKSLQDIVAVILRIVLIKLDNRSRKIVILDEPLSGLEIERQKIASKFLYEISEKFGIQLLVVTHSAELTEHATKEIRVS